MPRPGWTAASIPSSTIPTTPISTTRTIPTSTTTPATSSTPRRLIVGKDHFTKMSQELRFASPSEDRFRYVFGAFYQRQFHRIEQNYLVDGLASTLSIPGWPNTLWLTQEDRVDVDYAGLRRRLVRHLPEPDLHRGRTLFRHRQLAQGLLRLQPGLPGRLGLQLGHEPVLPAQADHRQRAVLRSEQGHQPDRLHAQAEPGLAHRRRPDGLCDLVDRLPPRRP